MPGRSNLQRCVRPPSKLEGFEFNKRSLRQAGLVFKPISMANIGREFKEIIDADYVFRPGYHLKPLSPPARIYFSLNPQQLPIPTQDVPLAHSRIIISQAKNLRRKRGNHLCERWTNTKPPPSQHPACASKSLQTTKINPSQPQSPQTIHKINSLAENLHH